VQPQEPSTGPVPQQPPSLPPGARVPSQAGAAIPPDGTDAAPEETGKPRNRRLRLWLAMGAGIMALLCLGGAGVIVSLYDNATKIVRTAPDAVVDNFLGSYLVNRNDDEAALYQCKTGGDFAEIASYRADIVNREKSFSVGVTVSWSSFTVSTSGDRGTVTTNLTKSASGGAERITKPWQFDVINKDGWRVCGASQIG
jgi:hypothetical protein